MAFNGQRLRVVRTFHNYTQRELAELIAVSPATISQYEKSNRQPAGEVLAALADVLGVAPGFFEGDQLDEFTEADCSFRDSVAASERLRRKVLAHGTLFSQWVQHLRQRVRFPAMDLPSVDVGSMEDVDSAADMCREHWGLGSGPIRQVTRVLENAGIIVTQLDGESTKVDAFSRYGDGLCAVVLNTAKGSSSRAVFDCIHELGHGVLHRGPRRKVRSEREGEANRFASAFLLPRKTFGQEFFLANSTDWSYLIEMKVRWGVSIAAILYRAHQLGLMNTAEFRRWQQRISAQGWRRGVPEPAEPPPVVPELIRTAYEQYRTWTGKTPAQLAEELGWTIDLFSRVTGVADIGPEARVNALSLEEFRARRALNS